jgi:hypothetical protein
MRQVTAGLERALAAAGWQVPATTALTGVRRRVGERPLESLFRRLCPALSPGRAPWSHAGGLLVAAVDGTTVAGYGSLASAAASGTPGTRKKPRPATGVQAGNDPGRAPSRGAGQDGAANPQLRLVTLVACGTRALPDAASGPVRGKQAGEQALARALLGSLHPRMLLLAGKNFYGSGLRQAAAGTGAELLHRPAHHGPRPPGRRPDRDRNRDLVLPGPPARRPRLPPRRAQALIPYPSRHHHDGPISQYASYTVTPTTLARHTHNSTDQGRRPSRQPDNPP